jgi:hypothetical protein
MKVIIADCSNEGILYIGDDLLVANQLKFGLVDTKIRILFPSNPAYELITREELFQKNAHYWINADNIVAGLDKQAFNPIYLKRRTLVKLRYPLMEELMRFVISASKRSKIAIWDGFENNIAQAISEYKPPFMGFPPDIQEYAHINRISPEIAFRELRLQMQNVQSLKMRIYAQQRYFMDQINSITTPQQFTPLYEELSDKFFRDSMIG